MLVQARDVIPSVRASKKCRVTSDNKVYDWVALAKLDNNHNCISNEERALHYSSLVRLIDRRNGNRVRRRATDDKTQRDFASYIKAARITRIQYAICTAQTD